MKSKVWLLPLILAGCSGEDPVQKPVVERFEGQPMIVDAGGDAKLVWTVRDAERIFVRTATTTVVETVEAEGATMVRGLQVDTVFTLEALNGAGSTFVSLRIAIRKGPPPRVDRFDVAPASILLSQTATLSWDTTDADEVAIATEGGEVVLARGTPDGSLPVSPEETTTYVLRATSGGGEITAQVILQVDDPRPEITAFTADPSSIPLGAMATLAWQVADADRIVIGSGGSILVDTGAASGTFGVEPTITTEYELSASNAFGTRIARVTVTVDVPATPRILTFRATPNPIALGAGTTIELEVDDADQIRLFEGDTEIASQTTPSGMFPVTPPAQAETTYRLLADNDVGTSTATLILYQHQPPSLDAFAIAPVELSGSATVAATWSVQSAAELQLFANAAPAAGFPRILSSTAAVDETGSAPIFVERTTFFEMVVLSAAGSERATAVAVIGILESEPNNGRLQADLHPGAGLDAAGRIEPGTDADWYAVAVPANGNIRAETTDAGGQCLVDTVLTVYASNGTTVLASDDDSGDGACSRIDPSQAAGLTAGTYYVVVTSKGGTGDYAVAIRALGPGCGNELIEGTEECDDGNLDPADGCSATCAREGVPEDELAGNDLPGEPGVLVATTDGTYFGSISPVGDDDVFAVTMPNGYNLEAYLTVNSLDDCPPDPQGVLALIAPNATTQLALDDDGGPSGNCGRIAVDTTAAALQMPGGTYFLRVSDAGDDDEIVVYFLHVRIVPPGCGNGLREPGESCDDGDQTSGDGCDASCQWELGPTITPPGGSTSVTLTEVGGASIVRVTLTANGQSIGAVAADSGLATCDEIDTQLELHDSTFGLLGSQSSGGPSGAAGACAALIPGTDTFATDLAAGTYYLFVRSEGGIGDAELDVDVINPLCGNGIRESRANENCDDNNLTDGDGCSSVCLLEGSSGLEVEPNGTQATANPTALIGLGVYTVVGENSPAGDDDVFSFVIPSGSSQRFTARTYSMVGMPSVCDSNLTDTRLLLERSGFESTGPGTNEIAYNDDRDSANNVWCSEISSVRLGAGTYYLRVQGWNDTQLTDYLLDLTLSP